MSMFQAFPPYITQKLGQNPIDPQVLLALRQIELILQNMQNGGAGIQPGEPQTKVVASDGGIGYAGPDNVPFIALRVQGDTHDRLKIWDDNEIDWYDNTGAFAGSITVGSGPTSFIMNGSTNLDLGAPTINIQGQSTIVSALSSSAGVVQILGGTTSGEVKLGGAAGCLVHVVTSNAKFDSNVQILGAITGGVNVTGGIAVTGGVITDNLNASGTVVLDQAQLSGVSTLSSGSAAPSGVVNGTKGDYYFRNATGGFVAGQNLYLCTVTGTPGTWVGIA